MYVMRQTVVLIESILLGVRITALGLPTVQLVLLFLITCQMAKPRFSGYGMVEEFIMLSRILLLER
jgi:hypothetical protein